LELPAPPATRPRYFLQAQLDYPAHSLVVVEVITYTNTTNGSLASLPLVVEAKRYAGGFNLGKITANQGSGIAGQPQDVNHYHWDGDTLLLSLPQNLAQAGQITLELEYTLALRDTSKLPEIRPYPLGYTSQQANFGDWYPFIPPFAAGRGWLIHPPATFGEHLVYDIADYEVAIRTGRPGLGQAGLVVAGPALAQVDGDWLRFEHPAARNFAWSVSPYYAVLTQTVSLPGGASVTVNSYHFPPHRLAAQKLLENTARSLQVFSERFGPYPHQMLSAVQADFLDGMEYDGLYFLSTDFYNWSQPGPQDFLVALSAHEAAHQWWGGLVGNDQALQPWLDETLCTYSEVIYYEATTPEVLPWWWEYRVNYYEPQGGPNSGPKGPVDQDIYSAGLGQYRNYRDPVYLRGALMMSDLRERIGDEPFFEALRLYVQQYAFGQAEAGGLINIWKQQAGQELGDLLGQYMTVVP
jgi:hypothetical protein